MKTYKPKINDNAPRIGEYAILKNACCTWVDFKLGFIQEWGRISDHFPTRKEWIEARNEWYIGNTGYEAAQDIFNERQK